MTGTLTLAAHGAPLAWGENRERGGEVYRTLLVTKDAHSAWCAREQVLRQLEFSTRMVRARVSPVWVHS